MGGAMQEPAKASAVAREAYFLEFGGKVRVAEKVPLMVTGGLRTAADMNAALRSGALDVVGVGQLLAIDPDAPVALLQRRDSLQQVRCQHRPQASRPHGNHGSAVVHAPAQAHCKG